MVGTLCGDALGAPYEWKSPDFIAEDFAKRGGLTAFDYLDPWKGKRLVAAGQPTDDSELAAALAQSLVEYKGLHEEDLFQRLRDFIHGNTAAGRRSILTEKAYGSGGTLRAALEPTTYQESVSKFAAGAIPTPPSNGSLMRCVGIPLIAFRDAAALSDLAQRQSMVTHRNLSSVAACVAYSTALSLVLMGMSPMRAWFRTKILLGSTAFAARPEMREVLSVDISKPDYEKEMKGKEGWVVLSLRVALWAAVTAVDFRDGITKAVSVGGDTDTYAAIAGGILGAHFGLQGIPDEWLLPLQGRAVMEGLGDSLYAIAHPELAFS
jgi:ADP-ribosyl-[dinitrogen reductase] hydrolase